MKTGFPYLISLIISVLFSINVFPQVSKPDYLKGYNENLFLILKYSDNTSKRLKDLTFAELTKKDFDGYWLNIKWDEKSKTVLLKNPDGKCSPVTDALVSISRILRADSNKILTLFLDFDSVKIDPSRITRVFQEAGLTQFLFEHKSNYDWPALKSMVESNNRLVIFSVQKHDNYPPWMHYVWNYAVEPVFPFTGDMMYPDEYFKGNPENELFIFNEFATKEFDEDNQSLDYLINRTALFTDSWNRYGKRPNFILTNHYIELFFSNIRGNLRSFKTISGKITFDSKIVDNVSWDGITSYTNGKYCFSIVPGEQLTISPTSPGYKFSPQSIRIDDSSDDMDVDFKAKKLEISQDLEAVFNLDRDARNLANLRRNGIVRNVGFKSDPVRGLVASFNDSSKIILPDALSLKLTNNSFTVSSWVKIPVYLPDKQDYCIIGSRIGTYLKGLHLIIRDKRPYFGFWAVDLAGKTLIEPGQWYHIVFRYNKASREQAIYVNGKLDSHGLGRTQYLGTDTLYVGVSPIEGLNNVMAGEIDNLLIWSRALSEDEIMGLSNQLVSINSACIIFKTYPLLSGIILAVLFLISASLLFLFVRIRKKRMQRIVSGRKLKLVEQKKPGRQVNNVIKLFGDFEVYDNEGKDITKKFTPKLKQLFLLLLLSSQDKKNGISTTEVSEILWKDYSSPNRSNIRRVAIQKLRTILNSIDEIKIVNNSGDLIMIPSENVYCDYLECLKLLKQHQVHDNKFYQKLYRIVSPGEIFKGESFSWLDEYKGYVSNSIVDILINYIEVLSPDSDTELILNISGLVLINDPLNDEAVGFKMKALIRQNNHKSAHFTFERFCSLYCEIYGEKYSKSFEQIIST